MYGSLYHGSSYHASNYYRGDEDEPESIGGGSGPSGKRRRELQQIADEDEIVIAFVAAFFQVVSF